LAQAASGVGRARRSEAMRAVNLGRPRVPPPPRSWSLLPPASWRLDEEAETAEASQQNHECHIGKSNHKNSFRSAPALLSATDAPEKNQDCDAANADDNDNYQAGCEDVGHNCAMLMPTPSWLDVGDDEGNSWTMGEDMSHADSTLSLPSSRPFGDKFDAAEPRKEKQHHDGNICDRETDVRIGCEDMGRVATMSPPLASGLLGNEDTATEPQRQNQDCKVDVGDVVHTLRTKSKGPCSAQALPLPPVSWPPSIESKFVEARDEDQDDRAEALVNEDNCHTGCKGISPDGAITVLEETGVRLLSEWGQDFVHKKSIDGVDCDGGLGEDALATLERPALKGSAMGELRLGDFASPKALTATAPSGQAQEENESRVALAYMTEIGQPERTDAREVVTAATASVGQAFAAAGTDRALSCPPTITGETPATDTVMSTGATVTLSATTESSLFPEERASKGSSPCEEVRQRAMTKGKQERGRRVSVIGDGWGGGHGDYTATVTDADEQTFSVIVESTWAERCVLQKFCMDTAQRETQVRDLIGQANAAQEIEHFGIQKRRKWPCGTLRPCATGAASNVSRPRRLLQKTPAVQQSTPLGSAVAKVNASGRSPGTPVQERDMVAGESPLSTAKDNGLRRSMRRDDDLPRRAALEHTLNPEMLGQRVTVIGDGWGGSGPNFIAIVTESSDRTFTVIAEPRFEEREVLQKFCIALSQVTDAIQKQDGRDTLVSRPRAAKRRRQSRGAG